MDARRLRGLFSVLIMWWTVLWCAAVTHAAEPYTLRLNDTNEPPYTTPNHDGFLDVVAVEAFRRAGATLTLVKLPPERGLRNANEGLEDGELTRIAGLELTYINLVRVEEKLIDWDFAAFSKNARRAGEWDAIRPLSVGHIKGWKIYERNLTDAPHVLTADDPVQLFRLLDRDRLDVALYERWLGAALIKSNGLSEIHPLAPSLATREMFIYLHKKHAALAPRVADALRGLKREGFYDREYKEKLQPYLQYGTTQ